MSTDRRGERRSPIQLGRIAALATALAGCTLGEPIPNPTTKQASPSSILQRSSPADGVRVADQVQQIELWFEPPARLIELTITDSDRLTIPTMITSVEPTSYYSVPLPGLSEGVYTVSWRATAGGESYGGTFRFAIGWPERLIID